MADSSVPSKYGRKNVNKIQNSTNTAQHLFTLSSRVIFFLLSSFSNEALQSVGIMKNASEMENQVFQKVQTQEEYRNMIGKIVVHMHSKCEFLCISDTNLHIF